VEERGGTPRSEAIGRTGAASRPVTLGLVVHHERELAVSVAHEVLEWAAARGYRVVGVESDAERLCAYEAEADSERFDRGRAAIEVVEVFEGHDLAVVVGIGGDGTMLRAAELASADATPILGVNAGQMGYLTAVEAKEAIPAAEAFLDGRCTTEDRMRIAIVVEKASGRFRTSALNEVVIEKAEPGHTVRINAKLNSEFFTSYLADGVIVATPTGSTAYSLSARGPIVEPTHTAMVVTPVAPHQLFDRSLVLSADAEVQLDLGGHRPAHVVVDGRLFEKIDAGERVVCTRSAQPSRFVVFGPDRFHEVLKRKFSLADR
jgi:NAD+ kinase